MPLSKNSPQEKPMSRETVTDLEELIVFAKNYSLTPSLANKQFVKLLSSQHKRYFALLTLLAELKHQDIKPVASSTPQYRSMNKAFLDYGAESVSDLGSALFVWIHGGYKGARQVLRSSVENFLKAIGSLHSADIGNLRNTYELIDTVRQVSFFQESKNLWMYSSLKQIYAMLCADVHTATIQQMSHISALGYFPNFVAKDAAQFEQVFLRLTRVYASILCLMFKNNFKKMHFKNRDIILAAITKDVRKRLHE
jgi:hypothetical protein